MDKSIIAKNWKAFLEEWEKAGLPFRDFTPEERKCFKSQVQQMLRETDEPVYMLLPKTFHMKDGEVVGFSGKQRVQII